MEHDTLILGLDGGQTSTVAVLCDGQGNLLGIGSGGPANHVHEPGGMERLEKALKHSIKGAIQSASTKVNLNPKKSLTLESACCGMTGGTEYVPQFLTGLVNCRHLTVVQDTATAHAGALAGYPGVIVIAGTGSVAYGQDAQGKTARSGGWAYIMGDEGSAYDLGRQALIAAARAEDGRGPSTLLLEEVLRHFGKKTLWEVRGGVYNGEIDRPAIASLAPVVVAANLAMDQVAHELLEHGGKALAEMAGAVLVKLKMERDPATVATVGGLFQAGEAILSPFRRHLTWLAPHAQIIPAKYPPVIGALMLAFKAADIPIDVGMWKKMNQVRLRLDELEEG